MALALLYLVAYPVVLNILIRNGVLSANKANIYFSNTPYTFSYVINDNNREYKLDVEYYPKMTGVAVDSSEPVTINAGL